MISHSNIKIKRKVFEFDSIQLINTIDSNNSFTTIYHIKSNYRVHLGLGTTNK